MKESRLLQFTEMCKGLAEECVQPYSSKYSRKDFTQPQHAVMNCLRIRLRMTYRDIVDLLMEMPGIRRAIGIDKVPHFTMSQIEDL